MIWGIGLYLSPCDLTSALSLFQALDLKSGDFNCLVARSQCHLELGNADAALSDAEEILKEEPKHIKVDLHPSYMILSWYRYLTLFRSIGIHRLAKCPSSCFGVKMSRFGGLRVSIGKKCPFLLFWVPVCELKNGGPTQLCLHLVQYFGKFCQLQGLLQIIAMAI